MSKIKELREKSARAVTAARAIIDSIPADASDEVRNEAHHKADQALLEAQGYDRQIDTLERLEQAEQRQRNRDDEQRERNRPIEPGRSDQAESGAAGAMTYRQAFRDLLIAGGDREMLTTEHRELLRRNFSQFEVRTQTAGTTTAGGFTVPTELANFIVQAMIYSGPMNDENIVTVINSESGATFDMPTIDDTASTVSKTAEGTAFTDANNKDATVGKSSLSAHMYDSEFIKISPQLIADSPFSWEQIVGDLIGERLGRRSNLEYTTGDGTGDPNGIVTAATLGKTTVATGAVTADEILEFIHSVDPAYRNRPKARVMFNDGTLLALRKLKDGQGNYLIRDALDLAGQLVVGSVRVPYSINQAMASMATAARFMVYGDFSKYYARKVGGVTLGILRERFWPMVGLAGYIRIDGTLADTRAVKYMRNA